MCRWATHFLCTVFCQRHLSTPPREPSNGNKKWSHAAFFIKPQGGREGRVEKYIRAKHISFMLRSSSLWIMQTLLLTLSLNGHDTLVFSGDTINCMYSVWNHAKYVGEIMQATQVHPRCAQKHTVQAHLSKTYTYLYILTQVRRRPCCT